MERIRPLAADDLAAVADLFLRVFRRAASPAPPSLVGYFRRLYLEHPLRSDDLPSHVFEQEGRVEGFLGALPLRFRFRGRAIRAVAAGNYMVNPDLHNPFAGVRLLKALLAGPQDLTFTDTANEKARKIWEGLGGATVPVYGLQWLRVLRPAEFAASLAGRSGAVKVFEPLARLAGRTIDFAGSLLPGHERLVPAGAWPSRELDADGLHLLLGARRGETALAPEYAIDELRWMVDMAGEKRQFGPLRMRSVAGPGGGVAGWFLYHPNPGGMGQVLQWWAAAEQMREVYRSMLADAAAQGALALVGRAEPRSQRAVSAELAVLLQRESYVEAAARDHEVLQALLLGDAFFTRLEGEWWTRLQGDTFT